MKQTWVPPFKGACEFLEHLLRYMFYNNKNGRIRSVVENTICLLSKVCPFKCGLLNVWWKYFFLFGLLRVFRCCCLFRRRWWCGMGGEGYRCLVSSDEMCFKRILCSKHGTCQLRASCGETQRQPIGCESSQINAKTEQESDGHRTSTHGSKEHHLPNLPAIKVCPFGSFRLLSAFAKLGKAPISFVLSFLSSLKFDRNNGYFTCVHL